MTAARWLSHTPFLASLATCHRATPIATLQAGRLARPCYAIFCLQAPVVLMHLQMRVLDICAQVQARSSVVCCARIVVPHLCSLLCVAISYRGPAP